MLGRSFRVERGWTRPRGSTTATGSSSPADGGVGCRWVSPESLPITELMRGLDRVVENMVAGRVWEEGMLGPGRIEEGTRGGSGGRSWGRRSPRVLLVALVEFWGEVERCWR